MENSQKYSHCLIFISLLLLSHTLLTHSDTPGCDANDQAVLTKIRDHFGGPTGPLSDWTYDNCCYWDYIGCDSTAGKTYGRVNAVTFPGSWKLSGTIPSYFGDLPYLVFLTISDNVNITGSIPKSLGKLKKLYHIDLSSNSLTGPIPKEVLQLKSLKYVDLSNNKLSGVIPPSVSSAKSLKVFNVSHNQLCGPIPGGLKKFNKINFALNKCLCGSPLAPCKMV